MKKLKTSFPDQICGLLKKIIIIWISLTPLFLQENLKKYKSIWGGLISTYCRYASFPWPLKNFWRLFEMKSISYLSVYNHNVRYRYPNPPDKNFPIRKGTCSFSDLSLQKSVYFQCGILRSIIIDNISFTILVER